MICAFMHAFGKRRLWQEAASGGMALRRAAPAFFKETATFAHVCREARSMPRHRLEESCLA